jgi:sugar/nucleoside kinase (ribokinase family)
MVSCGERGALLQNKNASVFAPCPPVKQVDTTGGGDIFGGGAVSRVLKIGKAPEDLSRGELAEILTFAVTAGSLSTQKFGGIPSIPEESEVQAVITVTKRGAEL